MTARSLIQGFDDDIKAEDTNDDKWCNAKVNHKQKCRWGKYSNDSIHSDFILKTFAVP